MILWNMFIVVSSLWHKRNAKFTCGCECLDSLGTKTFLLLFKQTLKEIVSDYLLTNESAHHINACNQIAVAMYFEDGLRYKRAGRIEMRAGLQHLH